MDTSQSSSRNLTSDTSKMPTSNHNINNKSKNDNVVSLQAYNSVLATLDVEVRARQHAQSQLNEARARVKFLEHQLSTFTSTSNNNNNKLLQPSQLEQAQQQPSPPQQPPQPPPSTSNIITPSLLTTSNSNNTNKQTSPEKEILSHCSDISNCNKIPSNNSGNGSAGGGSNMKSFKKLNSKKSNIHKNYTSKKERNTSNTNVKVKIPGQSRYWTPEEHKLFLEALQKFGHKDLRSISNYVGTRNMTQVRTHSQKYFMRLMREAKRQNPSNNNSNSSSTSTTTTMGTNLPTAPTTASGSTTATNNNDNNMDSKTMANNNTTTTNNNKHLTDSNTNNSVSIPNNKSIDESDKYSVPNTCGMTLLCLVGEDTRV